MTLFKPFSHIKTRIFAHKIYKCAKNTVEMIMEFETKFDIKIADDQAEKITTVGEAIAHIEKAIAEK